MYPNNGYGQTQYNQPQQPLPFSDREMQWPINQLAYGQPPVQMQIPCSPDLLQYVPLILNQLAVALQERATSNRLRIFLYNQMAANGFNNPDFYKLATLAAECIDLAMRTQPGARIEVVIQKAAGNVTQFMAAMNGLIFPQLIANLPPSDVHQVRTVVDAFEAETNAMRQALAAPQQQQPGWGMQPQQYNQYQQPRPPAGPGYAVAGHAFGGYPAPVDQGQASQWRGRAVGVNKPQQAPVIPKESTAIPNARNTFRSGRAARESSVTQQKTIRTVDPTTMQLQPVPIVPKTDIEICDEAAYAWTLSQGNNEVPVWKTSKLYPYTVAYNPNIVDLKYLTDLNGNTRPLLVKKEEPNMDQTAHLVAPKIAPSSTFHILAENTKMDRFSRKMALIPSDLEYVVLPFSVPQSSSADEHWVVLTTYLGAVLIDGQNKRQVARLTGVVTDSLVSNNVFKENVSDIAITTTPAATMMACRARFDEATTRSERHDLLVMAKLNQRLTDRINRFIRSELVLTSGTIESFFTDIEDLPAYLEKRYGETIKKAFLSAYPKMVNEVLTFAVGELHADLVEFYCSAFMEKFDQSAGGRDLMSFYQKNEYALIDLSAVELQVEVGSTTVAVGVKESLTPLFYDVCKTLLGEYDHTSVVDDYSRYYVRTNDGVTFEITRGAINKDFIFATLIK